MTEPNEKESTGEYRFIPLGFKVARNIDTFSAGKLQNKRNKRVALIQKSKQAKQFFSSLTNINKSTMTLEEKVDLLLDCFMNLSLSLANMENAYVDIFDNPFDLEERR